MNESQTPSLPAWLWFALAGGLILIAGLPRRETRAHSARMSTVTKSRPPSARSAVRPAPAPGKRAPAVKPLPRGAVKLADWEIALMKQGDTTGPGH